jgi:hypothetical protein
MERLGDLLASNGKVDDAKKMYERIKAEYPGVNGIQEMVEQAIKVADVENPVLVEFKEEAPTPPPTSGSPLGPGAPVAPGAEISAPGLSLTPGATETDDVLAPKKPEAPTPTAPAPAPAPPAGAAPAPAAPQPDKPVK